MLEILFVIASSFAMTRLGSGPVARVVFPKSGFIRVSNISLVSNLFGVSFALSCLQLELVCLEILGFVENVSSLLWIWDMTLFALILFVSVMLPLSWLYSVIPFVSPFIKYSLVTVLYFAYLYSFWKFGGAIHVRFSEENNSLFSTTIAHIGAVGFGVTAVLSGASAVLQLEKHANKFVMRNKNFDSEKNESQLHWVENRVSRLSAGEDFRTVRANDEGWNSARLEELHGLEELRMSLKNEIDDYYSMKNSTALSNGLDYSLSAFSLYSIIASLLQVFFGERDGTIVDTSEMALRFIGVPTHTWRLWASFFVANALVVTSMRSIVSSIRRLLGTVAHRISGDTFPVFLIGIMSACSLSFILNLRSSLPMEYLTILDKALEGLEFTTYDNWYHVLFLISALATGVFTFSTLFHSSPSISTDAKDV